MRYLKKIHGRWFYNRRVPEYARINDSRYPRVVLALRTADDETAIIQRNKQETADNKLWAALRRMADADGEGRESEATSWLEWRAGMRERDPVSQQQFSKALGLGISRRIMINMNIVQLYQ